MIHKSEKLDKLSPALVKARGEIPAVPKQGKANAGKFSYEYIELDDILKTVNPILAANGLTFVQMPTDSQGSVIGLSTMIMHESGQWIESVYSLPVSSGQNMAQEGGKAITYARRYALGAALGIATETDNRRAI